jgi:hypothetical protein
MSITTDQQTGSQPSHARLDANRKNAQRSTGPRTPGGKLKSSANALKFGCYAKLVVLPGEDQSEYDALRQQLWDYLEPRNPLEAIWTLEIANTHWRLQRLARIEGYLFTRRSVSFTGYDCGPEFAFLNDAQGLASFMKLAQCEAVLTRRLHRAMEEFRKLRKEGLPGGSASSAQDSSDAKNTPPPDSPSPPQQTVEDPTASFISCTPAQDAAKADISKATSDPLDDKGPEAELKNKANPAGSMPMADLDGAMAASPPLPTGELALEQSDGPSHTVENRPPALDAAADMSSNSRSP